MSRSQNTGAKHHPEKKIGPFPGGVGVAIWLNAAETDDGTKRFRSFTLSPRRYRDPESGKWRDAPSYRPEDIATLQFALSQAQAYLLTTPLPGDDEHDADAGNDGEY
ncbi:MAG: hypothetical protein KF708_24850 [Pirellulales bacterium]|nr:hypothetical protein [Pirellulales bacterium]